MTDRDERSDDRSGADGAQSGTFLVTGADGDAPVLRDVQTAQVLTLSSAPEPPLEEDEVLEATVAPEPPLEVTWELREIARRRTIDVIDSDLDPTRRSLEAAADLAPGGLDRTERAGIGEVHVLSVPPDEVEPAARDVLEDSETIARAARLGAVRVEVRRSVDEGVVSVRYLPD